VKSKRYEGTDLRRVLSGMVTDRTVCSRIASQWRDGGLFDAPWANLVGDWAVKHFTKYGQPPNGQLRGLFDDWSKRANPPEETLRGVESFLEHLSNEHSQQEAATSDYILDVAGRYFNRVRLKQAIDEAEDELERNDVESARSKLTSLGRVELGVGALIKPADDFEAWVSAFDEERQRPLVRYPGRLDKLVGQALVRDSLISFMGPDKSFKSFFMLDLAYRAIKNRCRVAFFEVGDLGQHEVLLRLGERATMIPRKPGRYKFPTSVSWDGSEVEYETRVFKEGLQDAEAFRTFRKVCRQRDVFRLSCHPNSSISVGGVFSIIKDWERECWVPDVVVIDYADILAPPRGVRESLDQIDETWKQLRRMSQELHALVVTASQSNAAAYKTSLLGKHHFSGRKTKIAHVNGMIGLNVSAEDRERGVTRLNWVVRRSGRYNERSAFAVAGCLAVSNPVIKVCEPKKIEK